MSNKMVDFVSSLWNRVENITVRLVSIEYSPKHGHEICVIQLAGKNAFPKMTPQEILSNPMAMVGMSAQDIVVITRLDEQIKLRQSKNQVLEVSANGTILLTNSKGEVKRYAEKLISQDRALLNTLSPEDAHDVGYRVGFKEGKSIAEQKRKAKPSLKDRALNVISLFRS